MFLILFNLHLSLFPESESRFVYSEDVFVKNKVIDNIIWLDLVRLIILELMKDKGCSKTLNVADFFLIVDIDLESSCTTKMSFDYCQKTFFFYYCQKTFL